MSFDVLPAIDLSEGRVVRLQQGDFARQTTYSDDPARTAREFSGEGARWLHVVDLDAARRGMPTNVDAIVAIVAATGGRAHVEVAGGLRTRDAVLNALNRGAARVVLGTTALADPTFVGGLVRELGPERVVVAVDVRHGQAVGEGWHDSAPGVAAERAIDRLAAEGVETFEVTAIDRDGLLGGPDLQLLSRLVGLGRGAIIASGGIRGVDDLLAVRRLGCVGAIVGRALYDGTLSLSSGLAATTDDG